ncbi:IS701 family transposase [Embleya sp. NPDC050154]|uniref:IS701 family transposase n=1 Tax=Embleya sp. NPDC050154 TaxID=3363988 RepID=UPI0037A905CA
MTGIEVVEPWSAELESLLSRVGHRFGRREPRMRMRDYVRGLLGPVGRKNGWQLAEYAGHTTPDGIQRLLASASWDPDELRDDVREFVAERLGEPDGVLIVDDTGFVKKGVTSAGVGRQYTGTSGKIDNCQIGVFVAYASRRGRALVDRELYLPKSWTADRDRCEAARIPTGRTFATKPEIARVMLARTLGAGMPVGWVAADEAFGADFRFRRSCEEHRVGYVVAVPKSQHVLSATAFWRIDALFGHAPPEAWRRLSCGDGAKGPRMYDWACARQPAVPDFDDEELGRGRWVLARRSLSDPTEIAYYMATGPDDTPLAELVRVAGARWAIEESFQAAKNECGLDEYEVRRYPGWYRHITLSMLAHAFLAALAADAAEKGETTPPNPMLSRSPWRRSGDSWQL